MTEQQFNKAKEIVDNIEKQKRDIQTLEEIMQHGRTESTIVNKLQYGCYTEMPCEDCKLSVDELKLLADYKAEKIVKLRQELSDL